MNRTVQLTDEYSVKIFWKPSQDADLSCLGKATDQFKYPGIIVREHGYLLGEWKHFQEYFPKSAEQDVLNLYNKLQNHVENNTIYNGIWLEDAEIWEPDDENSNWMVTWNGYEILAESKWIPNIERHQYKYVKPCSGCSDYNETWDEEDYKAALEDWKLLETYGEEWHYWDLVVTLFQNDKEIGSTSLGQIKDAEFSYEKELLADLDVKLAELLEEDDDF